MSFREKLSLLGWRMHVAFYLFFEEIEVKYRFYKDKEFRRCDRLLRKEYTGLNPYRICREFVQQRGEAEGDVYGETPLTTLAKIADACGLTEHDYVVDLGCGRGRGVFFLSSYLGCRAKGVEWVPFFISSAQNIARACSFTKTTFTCEEITAADLKEATFIYLCGTCIEERVLAELMPAFQTLKKGTKILTVSAPLTDGDGSFIFKKSFSVSFPWGKTDAYLHEKDRS